MIEDFRSVLSNFEEIRSTVKRYRDYLKEKNVYKSDNDVRFTFINQLDRILISHNLNAFHVNNWISDIEPLKRLFSTTNEYVFAILEDYIKYNKLALICTSSSILERLLRLILKAIENKENAGDDFYIVRKKFFKKLELSSKSNEWIALTTLFNIRNTIHNNGIHSTRNLKMGHISFSYHNHQIFFKNGFPHSNAMIF